MAVHWRLSIILTFAIGLSVVWYESALALAQSTPEATSDDGKVAFTVVPTERGENPYFEIEAAPGETIQLSATVLTVDSMPLQLTAFATNASSGPNGGFAAGSIDEVLEGSAEWISFPSQVFELGSDDSIDIPFSVSVPEDASPGQYVSALVAQTDAAPLGDSQVFQQVVRNAVAVVIIVPGELKASFELGEPQFELSSTFPQLIIPIENTGNILVKPQGTLTISSLDGEPIADIPVTMGSVYAFTDTTVQATLPQQFPFGTYVVAGVLTDTESSASAELSPMTIEFVEEEPDATPTPQFTVDPVSIEPVGDPIQFVNVDITLNNPGAGLPTATVLLTVYKDGKELESYALSQNQAIPTGTSTLSQRYIPPDGWTAGIYTFTVSVVAVDQNGTETLIATQQAPEQVEAQEA